MNHLKSATGVEAVQNGYTSKVNYNSSSSSNGLNVTAQLTLVMYIWEADDRFVTTPALLLHIHLYSHSGSCTDPRNCYWGESAQLKGGRFFKKKRWRRGYTKQEGRRWLTAKGEKREVQILLLGGKGSTQELMNWEQGVNKRGRNRPVKGQKKNHHEKKRKAQEEKRWDGEAVLSAMAGKSNRNLHITLPRRIFPLFIMSGWEGRIRKR